MSGDVGRCYPVLVRRDPYDGRCWLAEVPEVSEGPAVPGVRSISASSRSLAALDRRVRQLLAAAVGLPPGAADRLRLEWSYRTGTPALDEEIARLRRRRTRLAAAAAELTHRTGALAAHLVFEQGCSVRDAAAVLGLSPARVGQLVQERVAGEHATHPGQCTRAERSRPVVPDDGASGDDPLMVD